MGEKDLIIAGRYAKALFQAVEEKEALKPVLKDLAHLKAGLEGCPELLTFVNNPTISRGQAVDVMLDIAKTSKYNGLTTNFLRLLAEERRLGLFFDIVKNLKNLIAKQDKQLSGVVISAQKLEKAQLAQLQSVLKMKSGCDINLENQVDPDILGGLIIKLASYFIDSSLKTQLIRLNTHLKGLLDETTSV